MKSICLISGSSPEFLGGISLYQKNLIKYAREKNLDLDFTWIYPGEKNRNYELEGIHCIEIKSLKYPFLKEFDFARKVKKIISKKYFDIINTHANWGYCLKGYKEKENQKIIHVYHGVSCPYMKIQFARFGSFKYLFYPLLPFIYILEKPPIKKADKIICVSKKVKSQIENLYSKRKFMNVIRTGVDLSKFKKLSKEKSRREVDLEKDKIYGLYSGRGGYWNKGLDRAIKLSQEIYKIKPNYRLIIIGADKNKCKKYLNHSFVIYRGLIDRVELPKYYSSADFFFFLSRYEGGAPTLALSEAIASECLTICSKNSEPEILENKKDCLIIQDCDKNSAREILKVLKNKKEVNKMRGSAKNKIKELSLDKWGKKVINNLLN
jgi:glycosyltransferase involved in cell wall biosynthesis